MFGAKTKRGFLKLLIFKTNLEDFRHLCLSLIMVLCGRGGKNNAPLIEKRVNLFLPLFLHYATLGPKALQNDGHGDDINELTSSLLIIQNARAHCPDLRLILLVVVLFLLKRIFRQKNRLSHNLAEAVYSASSSALREACRLESSKHAPQVLLAILFGIGLASEHLPPVGFCRIAVARYPPDNLPFLSVLADLALHSDRFLCEISVCFCFL